MRREGRYHHRHDRGTVETVEFESFEATQRAWKTSKEKMVALRHISISYADTHL